MKIPRISGARIASSTRAQAGPRRVHGRPSDAVRWRVSSPPFLSAAALASAAQGRVALLTTQQYLQHCRDAAGVAVSDRLGARADRDDGATPAQRCVPDAHRPADLSRSYELASLSPAVRVAGLAEAPPSPRSCTGPDVPA